MYGLRNQVGGDTIPGMEDIAGKTGWRKVPVMCLGGGVQYIL